MSTRSEPRGRRNRIARARDLRVFPARFARAARRPVADRVIARVRALAGDALLFSHGHLLRVLAARWLGLIPLPRPLARVCR